MNTSPEHVLGTWLKKMSAFYELDGWGSEGYDGDCWNLVCSILEFADHHSKLLSMYRWLLSNEGSEFFERDDEFGIGANMVSIKLVELAEVETDLCNIRNDPTDAELETAVRNFYTSMLEYVPYKISLN
jgi:hypothetical protein